MCRGDDPNRRDFERHRLDVRTGLVKERRAFLKPGFAASGGAAALAIAGIALVPPALAQAPPARVAGGPRLHSLPANAETVHWGCFSKSPQRTACKTERDPL